MAKKLSISDEAEITKAVFAQFGPDLANVIAHSYWSVCQRCMELESRVAALETKK